MAYAVDFQSDSLSAAVFGSMVFLLSKGMIRHSGRCEIVHVLSGSSLRGSDGEG